MTSDDYRHVGRNPDGSLLLRTRILAGLGRLLGVHFHIGGWPYGAAYSGLPGETAESSQ